ncbi:hypothetical protein C8R44DRAFT_835990 [Mycena epipterygia]|nr:hypothetical protein C8R44DRAFT_835990 [Mycena epipterygia]
MPSDSEEVKKTVQFSATNILYSPLPWSPSPGASISSLPPSPSAETPPQLEATPADDQPRPPLYREPAGAAHTPVIPPAPIVYSSWPSSPRPGLLPRLEDIPYSSLIGRAQIHFLLSFSPFTPPHVHYDLSRPLHTINSQLTPSFLNPAMFPPLPSLTIRCRHIAWPIVVSPSHAAGFVSVLDVFTSVYTSLRLAVLRAEYDTLPSGDARQSVDDAYFTRSLKGVKHVDFLTGKTRFLGLSGPLEAPHVWELNVS